jgi:hypothetical protein
MVIHSTPTRYFIPGIFHVVLIAILSKVVIPDTFIDDDNVGEPETYKLLRIIYCLMLMIL